MQACYIPSEKVKDTYSCVYDQELKLPKHLLASSTLRVLAMKNSYCKKQSVHFFTGPLPISLQQNRPRRIWKEGSYFQVVPYFLVTHQLQNCKRYHSLGIMPKVYSPIFLVSLVAIAAYNFVL